MTDEVDERHRQERRQEPVDRSPQRPAEQHGRGKVDQSVGAAQVRQRDQQSDDDRGDGQGQQDEVLHAELEGRERDQGSDDERDHHPQCRAGEEVPPVGLGHVPHRIAADGAEGGVGDRDLPGITEQQIERQCQAGEEEDLVEVIDPQRHVRSSPAFRDRTERGIHSTPGRGR